MRCSECTREAVRGRSKCQVHGRSDPKHQADYGHTHQRMRKQVITPTTLCAWCGRPGTPDNPLELDHVVPWVQGGTNTETNYQPIHRKANRAKGGRMERRPCW